MLRKSRNQGRSRIHLADYGVIVSSPETFLVDLCRRRAGVPGVLAEGGQDPLPRPGQLRQKTTLLHMLKDERLVQHAPTQHPTSEELSIGWIKFKAFDLGGHQIARHVWKDYYAKVDEVVYMVDAADRSRFAESKVELDVLLSDDALAGVPFVVLGNKIDIPEAASEHELSYYLGLASGTTGKGTVQLAGSGIRPMEIFMCRVVRKMGYGEGFRWISQYIK